MHPDAYNHKAKQLAYTAAGKKLVFPNDSMLSAPPFAFTPSQAPQQTPPGRCFSLAGTRQNLQRHPVVCKVQHRDIAIHFIDDRFKKLLRISCMVDGDKLVKRCAQHLRLPILLCLPPAAGIFDPFQQGIRVERLLPWLEAQGKILPAIINFGGTFSTSPFPNVRSTVLKPFSAV